MPNLESRFETDPDKGPEQTANVPSVQIVQLEPADWEILRDLKISSLDKERFAFEDYEPGMARYRARTVVEWSRWLSSPKRIALFAKADDEYIGMVSAIIDDVDKTAQIQHMYVDEAHRGKGISRDLLNEILHELKEKGIERANLGVLESQKTAISLYENFGFVTTATFETLRSGKIYRERMMEKLL